MTRGDRYMMREDGKDKTMQELGRQITILEDQVKKLVAGEVTQYDLQAKLDIQLKSLEELLRLSEQLHHTYNETDIAEAVADALVERFGYEKAVLCGVEGSTGNLSVLGLSGYYDDWSANLVRTDAPLSIQAARPADGHLQVHTQDVQPILGMDQYVIVSCRSIKDEILGYITFGTSKKGLAFHRAVSQEDRPLWETIARLSSTAWENARLYGQLALERESLQAVQDNLRELNEQLERKVWERTGELSRSEANYRKLYNESEQTGRMYRTLLDVSPDPIVVYDIEGRRTYNNPAFTELFGWTFDELKGQQLELFPAETWPDTEEMMAKIRKGATFSNLEVKRFTKDNRAIDVSISGATYSDEHDQGAGSIVYFRDITERKRMEEELLRVRKLESVGLLAGGIAHDFNNIMAGILMNAHLATSTLGTGERAIKYLSGIEEAVQRATSLTKQLLTFSKGGAPVMKPASIADLIRESASFVLRGSSVKGHFTLPDDLWPVAVDEGQMNQVIQNLILNAQESMPDGGIIDVTGENLMVSSEKIGPSLPIRTGRHIRVSIRDQGVGILRDNLPKVFDPYFTTKDRGSGLGLAITYSIIVKHGGYITVDSEAGRGTVFHMYLPATDDISFRTELNGPLPKILRGQGRILIMDDEEIIRDLTRELLTKLGYQVACATDGSECLELYCKAREVGKPFDTVIMDLTVPGGMGGKETIGRLLTIDPAVKAIVSSGYANDPIMANFKRYGFSGVVTKPYGAEELTSELHRVLHLSPRAHLPGPFRDA